LRRTQEGGAKGCRGGAQIATGAPMARFWRWRGTPFLSPRPGATRRAWARPGFTWWSRLLAGAYPAPCSMPLLSWEMTGMTVMARPHDALETVVRAWAIFSSAEGPFFSLAVSIRFFSS